MIDFLTHQPAASYLRAAALIVTLGMGVYLSVLGKPLEKTGHGILALELAWTKDRAERIVRSWSAVKDVAIKQVRWDFVFIAGYAVLLFFIALTTEQAAATAGYARLAYVARLAAWGGLLAGVLDCLENIGLLVMLSGSITSATVLATSICAGVKFALAIFVLALAGLTFVLV